MHRRTVLAGIGGAALLGGGYLGVDLFAPERATVTDADAADGDETVLKRGTFVGKAGHRCSGTVELVEDAAGRYLQFRDYEQTPGPDVFCYLTPDGDPDTTIEVRDGTKVLIDGGADGGELTLTGTFVQRLPADLTADLDSLGGVAVWCENFSVPFGAATLEAV
jgi:hypothetical protein